MMLSPQCPFHHPGVADAEVMEALNKGPRDVPEPVEQANKLRRRANATVFQVGPGQGAKPRARRSAGIGLGERQEMYVASYLLYFFLSCLQPEKN